ATAEGTGRFSDELRRLAARLEGERIHLGSLEACLGRESIAGLLLILSLPLLLPIPAPGISVVVGIPLVLVSGQLLAGRRYAWLPVSIARRSVKRPRFRRLGRARDSDVAPARAVGEAAPRLARRRLGAGPGRRHLVAARGHHYLADTVR